MFTDMQDSWVIIGSKTAVMFLHWKNIKNIDATFTGGCRPSSNNNTDRVFDGTGRRRRRYIINAMRPIVHDIMHVDSATR